MLLLGVIAPCRVAAIHAQDDKWVRVVTPHFVIVSDASEKKARGVGIALERFHAEVDGGSTKDPTEAFVPTTIVAFADKESFQPYKLKTDGTPESYVGVFATSPDGNFIGLGLDVEEAREYHNQRVPTRGAKDTRSIHGVGTWEVGVPLEIKHGGILCSD